jgi:hypothetical protein
MAFGLTDSQESVKPIVILKEKFDSPSCENVKSVAKSSSQIFSNIGFKKDNSIFQIVFGTHYKIK